MSIQKFKESYKIVSSEDFNEATTDLLDVLQGYARSILYFEGDVLLDEHLDYEFIENFCREEEIEFQFIVVRGNLTVNGRINLVEVHPGLIVTGLTKAHTLEGADCEIYIQEGIFDYFIHGDYNNGILQTGKVKTQFVINTDHQLIVDCPDATFINNGSQIVDNYDYKYSRSDFRSIFIADVLFEKYIDMDKLYQLLKENKNIFLDTLN